MKGTLALALLLAAGCARQQPLSPYVPPEAMYSAGGTIAAVGGLVALSAGSSMMDSNSAGTRKAGMATAAAAAPLMAAAIADAIEVKKEREKFINLYNAFIRNYYGSAPPEGDLRRPPPPPPDVPFEIPTEESPLSGKDAKP